MKNYAVMEKSELIREIADLQDKRKKESAGAAKSISRLRSMIEELSVNMDERIREEVKKRLLEERFLLHESNVAFMEELAGNIAHQWRQPLNIIGLTVQKLQFDFERKEVGEGYVSEMVNEVLETVKQMSRTLQNFRDFMQIDRKRQQFNLKDSLRSVLSFLDGSMKSAGISVTVHADEEDMMLNGYRNEFCRVMLSMLNNSRKVLLAASIAPPLISVRLFRRDSRYVISIHDNGGCMDAIDGIFESQVATGSRGTGNNMVLHMSKAIIERKLGGKLDARNFQDGVEFRIEL